MALKICFVEWGERAGNFVILVLLDVVVVFPSQASFRSYEVLEATRFTKIFSRCLYLKVKLELPTHKKGG